MKIERVTIGGVDFVPEDRAKDEELAELRTRYGNQKRTIASQMATLDRVRAALEAAPLQPPEPDERLAKHLTADGTQHVPGEGRRRWPAVVAGAWLVIIGLVVGASAVPFNAEAPTLVETKVVEVPAPSQAFSTQSFAWDPEPGADGYVLGFYRMPGMAEQARFGAAESTLDVSLPAGEYRWYVWPKFGGTQSGKAIVSSTVTVS